MPRSVTIGNGNLLVGLDERGQVRDFYFPYVGHSNHVSGASGSYSHRIGIFVNGHLSWLTDSEWEITAGCNEVAGSSDIVATHKDSLITLHICDVVHNEKDIFLRKVRVTNGHDETREVKVFFGQEFRISESRRGDTAFYDPRVHAIIHYKGHDAFLVNAEVDGIPFEEYSVGLFDIEGKKGTYADAEDGVLSKNAIEHGSADSVIGVPVVLEGGDSVEVFYWIAAGKSIAEAHDLHTYVVEERPEKLIESTEHYWDAWMDKEDRDLTLLDKDLQQLYKRSLAIIRVHTDNRGGIIASSDSDMLNQGRDSYSYVWPRDAAIVANALDRAGYIDATQKFFSFMSERLERDGYLMHKYRVDGVLGSSWHPWVRNGEVEIPIQEDETALVVFMLERHYEFARDLEFIESLYNPFIEPAANFMCEYLDEETHLPLGSYDLWEEKYGTSTYSSCAVYGALQAAATLSALLGKRDNTNRYRTHAERIKDAILAHLYDAPSGMFVKLVTPEKGAFKADKTIDISSFHGLTYFGVLDAGDQRVQKAYNIIEKALKVPTEYGGYMRYDGDNYYRTSKDAPPNAWIITTLWVAQYHIKRAATKQDLEAAYELMRWVYDRSLGSGVLPEQIHPYTGEHLSTSPLVWSHAEFVNTVDEYIKKYKALQT